MTSVSGDITQKTEKNQKGDNTFAAVVIIFGDVLL